MAAERAVFRPEQRLRRPEGFRRCMRRGQRLKRASLVAICLPREEGAPSRLGLVVGKRVGNAPVRNRVKRLLRAAFRQCPQTTPPRDLVVQALPGAAALSFTDAKALVDAAFALRLRTP